MTNIVFRLAFTADKPPPEITCADCGSIELQAGISVRHEDINTTRGESGDVSTVNTRNAKPLCEVCVKSLMAAQ